MAKKITDEQRAAVAECERRGWNIRHRKDKYEIAVRGLRNLQKLQPLTDTFFIRRRKRNYWIEDRRIALLRDVIETLMTDDEQYFDRYKINEDGLRLQFIVNIRKKPTRKSRQHRTKR